MPTYSYACTECSNQFDIFQSFTEDSLTQCPECTGKLRKLFNSVGIVFKGSGFYRNDSRSGSGKGSATGSSSAKETAAASSTSTDSGSPAPAAASSGSGASSSSGSAKVAAAANSVT